MAEGELSLEALLAAADSDSDSDSGSGSDSERRGGGVGVGVGAAAPLPRAPPAPPAPPSAARPPPAGPELDDLLLSSGDEEGGGGEAGAAPGRGGARANPFLAAGAPAHKRLLAGEAGAQAAPTEATEATKATERQGVGAGGGGSRAGPAEGRAREANPFLALAAGRPAAAAPSPSAQRFPRAAAATAAPDAGRARTPPPAAQRAVAEEEGSGSERSTRAEVQEVGAGAGGGGAPSARRLPAQPPPSGVFGADVAAEAEALALRRNSGAEASSAAAVSATKARGGSSTLAAPAAMDAGEGNAAALFHRPPCVAMLAAEERERLLAAGAARGAGGEQGGARRADCGHASNALRWMLAAPPLLPSALRAEPAGALAHAAAHARRVLGTPACVAASAASGCVAVGGSTGVVLVGLPDAPHGEAAASSTKLLGAQGGAAASATAAAGAVSCMAFDPSGEMLLVGHASGQVAVWDVSRGTQLRRGTEHSAAITSAAFVRRGGSAGVALTADAAGVVLMHALTLNPFLKRLTAKVDCLLDGKKAGPVPLVVPASLAVLNAADGGGAPTVSSDEDAGTLAAAQARGVSAICTLRGVMFVRLFPAVEVCTVWNRPEAVREGALPYAAWRVADDASGVPLQLAVAWGKVVTVLGVDARGGFALMILATWELEAEAAGAVWLEGRSLCVLSAGGRVSVREPMSGAEVAALCEGIGGVGDLAYHAHVANAFGNPERASQGAVCVGAAGPATGAPRMYMLGARGVSAAWLRPWDELCASVASGEDGVDGGVGAALALASEIACAEPLRVSACAKLPREPRELAARMTPALRAMCAAFAGEAIARERSMAEGGDGGGGGAEDDGASSEAPQAAAALAEFCLRRGRPEAVADTLRLALFEDAFGQFSAAGAEASLLDALEERVLAGQVSSLPPELMQALVELRAARGEVARVEAAVLNMDIASLDINQCVRLCESHQLYSALADIFSRGLGDVLTPLERLLAAAERDREGGASAGGATSVEGNAPPVVYKLLLLLRCCFVGERFPPGRGALDPPAQAAAARQTALEFIAGRGAMSSLLRADAVATLETLGFGFDVPPVAAEGAGTVEAAETRAVDESLLQAVADSIATQAAEAGASDGGEGGLSPFASGLALEFVAEQAGAGRVSLRAPVAACALQQLAAPAPPPPGLSTAVVYAGHAARRQRAFMAVMDRLLRERLLDVKEIERMARLGGFLSAVAKLRARLGDLAGGFEALLADGMAPADAPHRALDAMLRAPEADCFDISADFSVRPIAEAAEAVAVDPVAGTAREQLLGASRAALPALAARNAPLAAELMAAHFAAEADSAIDALGDTPELQLECLRRVVGDSGGGPGTTASASASPPAVAVRCAAKYVRLLCHFEPQHVVPFLRSNNGYDLDACLAACRDGGSTAGAALLLERAGETNEALRILLREARLALACLAHRVLIGGYASSGFALEEARAIAALGDCAALCDRAVWDGEADREAAWFDVVRCAVGPLREVRWAAAARAALGDDSRGSPAARARAMGVREGSWLASATREALRRLLAALARLAEVAMEQAASALSLADVLKRLVDEHGAGELGDFRETIAAMLGSVRYQSAITSSARALVAADAFGALDGSWQSRRRAKRLAVAL